MKNIFLDRITQDHSEEMYTKPNTPDAISTTEIAQSGLTDKYYLDISRVGDPRLEYEIRVGEIDKTGSEDWSPGTIDELGSGDNKKYKEISVPGATAGERPAVSYSRSLRGLKLTGSVTGSDTVLATITNHTDHGQTLEDGVVTAIITLETSVDRYFRIKTLPSRIGPFLSAGTFKIALRSINRKTGAASDYSPDNTFTIAVGSSIDGDIDAAVLAHSILATGIHGVAASTVASVLDVSTHSALETGVHGAGTDTLAVLGDITAHEVLTTGIHGVGDSTIASLEDIEEHAVLKSGVHGLHTTFRNMGRDRFLAKIFKKGYFKKEVF